MRFNEIKGVYKAQERLTGRGVSESIPCPQNGSEASFYGKEDIPWSFGEFCWQWNFRCCCFCMPFYAANKNGLPIPEQIRVWGAFSHSFLKEKKYEQQNPAVSDIFGLLGREFVISMLEVRVFEGFTSKKGVVFREQKDSRFDYGAVSGNHPHHETGLYRMQTQPQNCNGADPGG